MIVKKVKLEDVYPSESNPRADFDLDELVESVRATGGEPVNPILLVQDGGIYRIVDGERRYRAMLELGTRECSANVADGMDEANVLVAMLATDSKKPLTALERSRGTQQALLLGVAPEKVEKVARVRGAAKVNAGAKVVEESTMELAEDMSLEQLIAVAEAEEAGWHDSAVAIAEAGKRWERVHEGWKRLVEHTAEGERMLVSLRANGVEVVDERPEGMTFRTSCSTAKSLEEWLAQNGGEALSASVNAEEWGCYCRVYGAREDAAKVDPVVERNRALANELDDAVDALRTAVLDHVSAGKEAEEVVASCLRTWLDTSNKYSPLGRMLDTVGEGCAEAMRDPAKASAGGLAALFVVWQNRPSLHYSYGVVAGESLPSDGLAEARQLMDMAQAAFEDGVEGAWAPTDIWWQAVRNACNGGER